MPSSLFQIEPSELQAKLCPRNAGYSFLIDDDTGDLTEAEVLAILNTAEDRAMTRLSPRYRRLLRRVEAEFLVRQAEAGQTTLQTGLAPITGGLKLYKNYAFIRRGWSARRPADELSADLYTADLTTGEITLATPLQEGESVLAEYDHAAAGQILVLRDAVLTLAAVEISRRLRFTSADGVEVFGDWETAAFADLTRGQSYDLLDNLDVAFETDGDPQPYRYILEAE